MIYSIAIENCESFTPSVYSCFPCLTFWIIVYCLSITIIKADHTRAIIWQQANWLLFAEYKDANSNGAYRTMQFGPRSMRHISYINREATCKLRPDLIYVSVFRSILEPTCILAYYTLSSISRRFLTLINAFGAKRHGTGKNQNCKLQTARKVIPLFANKF